MELKINIYNELDEVIKTYTRQSYSLRMRQLKLIIETLELDKLAKIFTSQKKKDNAELIELVSNFVLGSYNQVQYLMQDIFVGLEDEEYLETHVDEVVQVLINVGKYAFTTIGIAGSGQKN